MVRVHPNLFLDLQEAVAGRYSLQREIGRGGMGIVYLARDISLDRSVAIKLLPPELAVEPGLRKRFLREVRTVAKLSHPNIIPLYSVEEAGPYIYFVMAYVEGQTLARRIRMRGPLSPGEARRVLREVSWALAYAHAQGVINRDVKSDNILLEEGTGRALVADFGIAHLVYSTDAISGGHVLGTAEFMSPEQARGDPVDARSDIYSLGVVGYHALSGKLPFDGVTVSSILAQQIIRPAPPLAAVAPRVPRELTVVVDRCLEKNPSKRFATAEELGEALAQSYDGPRDIPVPVRAFHLHSGVSGFWVLYYVFALEFSVRFPIVLPALLALPFVFHGLYRLHQVRRLLWRGYTLDHVRLGLRTILERRREELPFLYGRKPRPIEIIARTTAYASFGVAAITVFLMLFFGQAIAQEPTLVVFSLSAVTGVVAGFLAAERAEGRRGVRLARYARVWGGRIGRWVFKLASIGLEGAGDPARAVRRPAEDVIAGAAQDLYATLPRSARRELKDLPHVVHYLQSGAAALRARVESLREAFGVAAEGGSPADIVGSPDGPVHAQHDLTERRDALLAELRMEKETAEQRLADAVAALEAVRLNLLRLHAGTTTAESVTVDLETGRKISEQLDIVLSGPRRAAPMLSFRNSATPLPPTLS